MPRYAFGIRHAVDLGRERAEPGLVRMRLRRQRERHAACGRGSAPSNAMIAGRPRVRARELDGVLDRLRAGVEERRLRGAAERRDREQPLGERDVDLVRDHREVGVEEARGLLLHGLDDMRVRVADVQAADAAREVDERVAVDVGEGRAAALGDDDRQVDRERIRDDPLLPLEDRPGLRPGDRRLQVDCSRRRHASHHSRVHGRITPIQPRGWSV